MKPTPEIESAAKEFAKEWWSDEREQADLAPFLARFLAKLIAQERAKVWEEAAEYLVDHDDAFPQDYFRRQAAAERREASDE